MKEESDRAEGAESAKARGESGLARSGHWKGEPSVVGGACTLNIGLLQRCLMSVEKSCDWREQWA